MSSKEEKGKEGTEGSEGEREANCEGKRASLPTRPAAIIALASMVLVPGGERERKNHHHRPPKKKALAGSFLISLTVVDVSNDGHVLLSVES